MAESAIDSSLLKKSALPRALYSGHAVRELDARYIAQAQVTGLALMQRAGRSAFRHAKRRWPAVRHWLVLCGTGNNGGDGFIIAAQAVQQGHDVRCLLLGDTGKLQGDARRAYEEARQAGVAVETFSDTLLHQALVNAELVVDAMLGTGLTGAVRAPYDAAIEAVNQAETAVMAVDMPSGLCSDTGTLLGKAVQADLTITFIGLKLGLFTGKGPGVVGELVFDSLGCDDDIAAAVPAVAIRLDWATARVGWPKRSPTAHKGDFGRVLVIGGDLGMGGAALLAAEAAARSGAGMVFVATQPEHVSGYLARRPELIVRGVRHRSELLPLLEQVDAVIVGPGLGQGPWGQQLLQAVRTEFDGPVLIDADGLNLLAKEQGDPDGNGAGKRKLGNHVVLTPHPGEAARLLGCSVADIERDRIRALDSLSNRYGCVVLLKGAGTLVKNADSASVPTLIDAGNAGMASGGMGDVLCGLIGALLGQGQEGVSAAILGGVLHGASADLLAAELSMAGMLAGDLPLAAARLLKSSETRPDTTGAVHV
ncbi:MAG: bifunctional ADP-dependent NAD(P)H-hydrate dehydratase/NAD(P)H-hydrate epimerase [Alteromonadaceae bacterium]|nr:bifunctional ADP-dependent NAD(P)H-hydrate dehydratase/NAD(P)H-hydrate epimerase [Alteromonadaceae bacterium]|tara:strand:- start:1375 stop:2985 length:1611 start_codon:yes stop_codon:yes gene_type:complete